MLLSSFYSLTFLCFGLSVQTGDGRTTSICDSITSTVTAGSEEESLSDDDNDEDNGDDSDTASAPSPNPLRTEEGESMSTKLQNK